MPDYVIEQGDCLSSIAEKFNLASWKSIYNHGNNADFRSKRPDPNVVYPGDIIFVPEKALRQESGATEQRHRFRYKGKPTWLRLVVKDLDGKPLAGKRYELKIESDTYRGSTASDGLIEQRISPQARDGRLTVWTDDQHPDKTLSFELNIGCLDPVEYLTGVQARLKNVGFDCGPVDGVMGPKTQAAVKAFQTKYSLKVDGIPGPKTQAKLKEIHGS